MTLNEYQERAMSTCMDSCKNPMYMLLNLQGEVGEISSKVAKHIRKGELKIFRNMFWWRDNDALSDEQNEANHKHWQELLKAEAGDIAWQLAGLCKAMGWSLEEVCQANLDKLKSRQERGVISGEGDER